MRSILNNAMVDFDTTILKKGRGILWEVPYLEIFNRGFLFADGLFETMIFINGSIRFSNLHQQRLLEGAKVLGLDASGISTIDQLEEEITKLGVQKALRIRWSVFRGGLGKYTPETNVTEELLQIQPWKEGLKIKSRAYFSSSISVPVSPWSHCKTLNALIYVMANKERMELSMDEVILLTPQGLVSEAGSSNIFWIKNNRYFTPSLLCNGISGIGRKNIIQKLEKEGYSITEGEFYPEDLLGADQVFTSNVTGISYLQSIGNTYFDITEIDFLEQIFKV